MDRDRLLVALASVFAGLTVLLTVVALSYQPLVLVLAIPFGVTAYFMWYQGTGRLRDRVRRRAGSDRDEDRRAGFGAGARREAARDWEETWERRRAARKRARRGGSRRGSGGRRESVRERPSGPSRAEAYRTLGVDPGAGDDEVRRAYRRLVKEVHPDAESGDEEEFKRVNRAYEALTDG